MALPPAVRVHYDIHLHVRAHVLVGAQVERRLAPTQRHSKFHHIVRRWPRRIISPRGTSVVGLPYN
jgi:hypothetical protein